MKITFISLAILSSLLILKHAHATEDCDIRRADIERELLIAQQYSNENKIAGLNAALSEVNSHCTRESVREKNQRDSIKLQNKINDKNKDIRELTHDLHRAEAEGDRVKAAKIWRKLDKKQYELRDAQGKLDTMFEEKKY